MSKIDLIPSNENDISENLPIQDFVNMLSKARVKTDDVIEIDPAIQIGWYTYLSKAIPIPFGSYGDFSCIVGPSKSMKSFLIKALVASYIGGRSTAYFPKIIGVGSKEKFIVEIDTEQSRFHVKRGLKTVEQMTGSVNHKHLVFQMRGYDHLEIIGFIKWLCYESMYAGTIGLLVIDGAADLVDDVNDGPQSKALAKLFMKITDDCHLHLITVLHRNFGSKKPTGHLGSAILKKAETIAFVERDETVVKVSAEYCRNYPFRGFSFTLDDNGVPIDTEEFDNIFREDEND